MATIKALTLAAFLSALGCARVRAETELIQGKRAALRATADAVEFQGHLREALGQVLGCGDTIEQERLESIKQALKPIWGSLPKTAEGRVERRLLRYVTHRYFTKSSSIMIRGFEPSRPANQSLVGAADILSQQVPAAVEAALESRHAQERGFDLADAAHMVATVEKLISDWDSSLLEKAFLEQRKPVDRPLSRQGLEQVLQDYMVHWMMGDDVQSINTFMRDRSMLAMAFPRWEDIQLFTSGQIRALDHERRRAARGRSPGGATDFKNRYTFEDARKVVASITRSFASFWDGECEGMKEKLIQMDRHHTGRVPLSKFYSQKLSKEWRFGESEDYLRELGALDETSRWHGKEVIIPNYIAAASNCIVATPHYLVCCMDPCEGIMSEIETGIGAPVASADEILAVVGNVTTQTSLDEEVRPKLQGTLARQLEEIAEHHNGKVPLHGRLFAQWVHYAFPRECPFPHRTGTTSAKPPSEYGVAAEYLVKEDHRQAHAENETGLPVAVEKEDLQWMSQWSPEEELPSGYAELRAPWEPAGTTAVGTLLVAVVALAGLASFGHRSGRESSLLPTTHGGKKAHFV